MQSKSSPSTQGKEAKAINIYDEGDGGGKPPAAFDSRQKEDPSNDGVIDLT